MNEETTLTWECRPAWLCILNGRVTDCGIEKMSNNHDAYREREKDKEE